MSTLRAWALRFGGLFRKEQRDREFEDEIQSHLQMHIEDNLRAGMTLEEAQRAARLKFGGIESAKESYRDQRGIPWLEHLLQDVRFGLRMLRKNPGFTAVAILTLALGIGANTAIFSVVDAVLLRSLPFKDSGQLVAISETSASTPEIGVSVADYDDWRRQVKSLEGLAAYNLTSLANATAMINGEPQEVRGAIVSHNLFQLLGISPEIGRSFLPQEDEPGNGPVAVLSGEMWRTRFSSNPQIVGQSLSLDGTRYTIVGVLPIGVRFPQDADLLVPLGNLDQANRTNRFYHPLFAIGRLSPRVSVAKVRTEMKGISERLSQMYPQTNHDIGVTVEPLLEEYVGGLHTYLLILWVAVGMVLLIACANVASLLLARSANREVEMALRGAIGASRSRIVRQGLTESIILALVGGLAGLLTASAALLFLARWLSESVNEPILQLHQIGIDSRVVVATLGISIFSGCLFGIFPAVHASRSDLSGVLQSGQRGSPSGQRRLAHRVVVGGEVALAVIVLAVAGLIEHSSRQLMGTSPGFRVDHLLSLRISLPAAKYKSREAMAQFYQRLLPKLRALPGIDTVGTIDQTPLIPNMAVTRFLVDGAPPVRPGDYPVANYRVVSPEYFQTMRIPLLTGRLLADKDLRSEVPVLVINRTLRQQFFRSENPVGRNLLLGIASGRPYRIPIVGVVDDVRDLSIGSPAPAEMYFAGFAPVSTLIVRTTLNPLNMVQTVRETVLSVDPSEPIFEVHTGTQLVRKSMAHQQVSADLLESFSALALILATVGIYGVSSYSVAERTREIGVRRALGAQSASVLWLILRQEISAAAIGVAVGSVSAIIATRPLSRLLYEVSPTDPMTYCGVCLVVGAAAVLACWIPARRASKVDPIIALRYE